MHDAWIHKVCALFKGNMIFDDDVHILYRQHENNVIGITTSWFYRIKFKIERNLLSKKCERSRIIESLYNVYNKEMDKDQKHLCWLICNYKNNFRTKLKLLTNRKIKTRYLKRNIFFKLTVINNSF